MDKEPGTTAKTRHKAGNTKGEARNVVHNKRKGQYSQYHRIAHDILGDVGQRLALIFLLHQLRL